MINIFIVLFILLLSGCSLTKNNVIEKKEIKLRRCVVYPKPEDVEKYKLEIVPKEYCGICGDGICDYIEGCFPSNPTTADCNGGLFCQQDCNKNKEN